MTDIGNRDVADRQPGAGNASKSTVERWWTENATDTREADGPDGRVYTASFATVWDGLLEEIRRKRRWELVHADEELGLFTAVCRSLIFGFKDDLTIWVSLDENGLTRVEARSAARVGRGDFGVNERRVERLLARLDRHVGPDAILGRGGQPR